MIHRRPPMASCDLAPDRVALWRGAARSVVQFSKQGQAVQHHRCSGRLRHPHRRWPVWGFASRVGGNLWRAHAELPSVGRPGTSNEGRELMNRWAPAARTPSVGLQLGGSYASGNRHVGGRVFHRRGFRMCLDGCRGDCRTTVRGKGHGG